MRVLAGDDLTQKPGFARDGLQHPSLTIEQHRRGETHCARCALKTQRGGPGSQPGRGLPAFPSENVFDIERGELGAGRHARLKTLVSLMPSLSLRRRQQPAAATMRPSQPKTTTATTQRVRTLMHTYRQSRSRATASR